LMGAHTTDQVMIFPRFAGVRFFSHALPGALALFLGACAQQPSAARRAVALLPCRLKSSGLAAQCGSLRVLEDRANPHGRAIDLKIAVVPALARDPAPDPLFLLAGGPGQAATEVIPPVLGAFERIRRTRDLVMVDQRGTGSSHALACDLQEAGASLAQRLGSNAFRPEVLRKCLASYDADPRFYTTSIAMQDLEEARQALGYDQIDVWGGSYGSRAALVYLREHGEHVRVAILDGVFPTSAKLVQSLAPNAQRAMDLLFAQCQSEPACSAAFPDLSARFAKLLDELSRKDAQVRVEDPLTGKPTDVAISYQAFAGGIRGLLHQEDLASLVPLIVSSASQGEFGPYVAAVAGMAGGFNSSLSFGLMFSVVCAEDLVATSREQAAALAERTFLGPRLALQFLDICSFWPHGQVAPLEAQPVASNKPVLLLSGELDPVTPPSWAEEAGRTLLNSLHLLVPGVGHGVSAESCIPRLMAQFIEEGSASKLDRGCFSELKRPAFLVNFAGPPP
jgi:pimeloyl-ACP methyl ester carboxylesterase